MRRLFGYMRRFKWRYAFGVSCTFATATLAMVVPYLLKTGIDAIQSGHYERLPKIAASIWGTAMLMGAARWCSRFTIFNIGNVTSTPVFVVPRWPRTYAWCNRN